MSKKRNYKILGDFEMEGKQAEKINKMIENADREIEKQKKYYLKKLLKHYDKYNSFLL